MLTEGQSLDVTQIIKYTNIKILGKGTNGTVYYALRTDGLIKKEVALKALLIGEGEDIHQIVREATLVSKIHHSNIIFVNTTFIKDGYLYIEYDYIDGLSLDQFIKYSAEDNLKGKSTVFTRENAKLPEVNQYYIYCCLIILQVLNGLRAAFDEIDFETNESLKIVHRDLCPSNILLSRNGIIKIADFGLAYKKDFKLEKKIVIGKLAYCSPEQLKGKGHGYDQEKGIVHQTTDIFSVGVIFFELLTQQTLFPIDEMNLAMKKIHSHEGFIALRSHLIDNLDFDPKHADNKIPTELSKIINKALRLNPKKRYQKYQDMSDDLSEFMTSLDSRMSLWNLKDELKRVFDKKRFSFQTNETIVINK
ncbi:MAG: hypothetical protein COA79_24395 [Planctomycetota bacterium]|nr:MAG: hypothetical protein COA79_24395 [Planctomycetota bacterium]